MRYGSRHLPLMRLTYSLAVAFYHDKAATARSETITDYFPASGIQEVAINTLAIPSNAAQR